jgi:hypothetical protein
VCAGEPILIRCCAGDVSSEVHELIIFDSVGRKIRIDTIEGYKSFLKPIRKTGIYFIVSAGSRGHGKQKFVVID